jgi:class 3 adenylate cyclase
MTEASALFDLLRQAVPAPVVDALERFVRDAPERKLARINALTLATELGLDEEPTIGVLLHATHLGLFELYWNVLCPGCGGVLDANTSLKTVRSDTYSCALCAAGYEPTLDQMVEVTFTVSPRVRAIAAHHPHELPPVEYFRQIYWCSGVDLPDDDRFNALLDDLLLEVLELPPGEKAVLSLQLPEGSIIVFEPVTHAAQFLDVKGEPTRERQSLSLVFDRGHRHRETIEMRPGPLRIAVENLTDVRTLPSVCVANDALHGLLGQRRPFLTAKRLLSNQTFRDIYRTDTLDVSQRLKVTSLTFLFTDLRGSTALYERVGDLAAFDLVQTHFAVLNEIVATEAGAVVKTIGDAVMATFPTPDRAVAAALRMREAMRQLNQQRGNDDLLLKIGIHEGPCIAVNLNERQDYFGQAVNIASRVQHLATPQEIFATDTVLDDPQVASFLALRGLTPTAHGAALRGIATAVGIFAIP